MCLPYSFFPVFLFSLPLFSLFFLLSFLTFPFLAPSFSLNFHFFLSPSFLFFFLPPLSSPSAFSSQSPLFLTLSIPSFSSPSCSSLSLPPPPHPRQSPPPRPSLPRPSGAPPSRWGRAGRVSGRRRARPVRGTFRARAPAASHLRARPLRGARTMATLLRRVARAVRDHARGRVGRRPEGQVLAPSWDARCPQPTCP